MKIKYISILIVTSFLFSQEDTSSQTTAVVKFQSSGLNEMENQAFFEYFLQELNNASDNTFIDQKIVADQTKMLELTTDECFSKECLSTALNSTSSDQLITGSIQFSKNKFRAKIQKLDANAKKPEKYNIRYKGEVDGFITELQILAWEVMGKNPPGSLSDKRVPSTESFLDNPFNKRIVLFSIAGFAGASYVKNTAGYNKSMDGYRNDGSQYRQAHLDSADKSKNKANASILVMLASLGYAYYDGLLTFGE